MSSASTGKASVKHGMLAGKKVADCLVTLDNVCTTGAQCVEVQGSASASQALTLLKDAVKTGQTSLSKKLSLAQALIAAIKALDLDIETMKLALRGYEAAVDLVAAGDAKVITNAGLLARTGKASAAALDKVAAVYSQVGKHAGETILTWPAGPGATSYALEVNFTPLDPAGSWVALTGSAGRRRVVKAPMPASQILARVASVASDGTQSDWSDPIMATTL